MTVMTYKPKMPLLCRVALLSCCCMTLSAQKRVIEGNIVDRETGYPLDRVNVSSRGEALAHSNRDGYYKAMAVPEDTLVYRCVGYETCRIAAKDVRKNVKMRQLWVSPDDTVVGEARARRILERLFRRMEEDEAQASGMESRYSMTAHYTRDGSRPMSVETTMRTTCGLTPRPIEMNTRIDGKDLAGNESLRRALDRVYYPDDGGGLMKFDFAGTPINYAGCLEDECVTENGKVVPCPPQIAMLNGNTHLFAGISPRAREAHGWELSYVPLYDIEETRKFYTVTADSLGNRMYRLAFRWKKGNRINEDNRGVVTGYAYVDAATSRLVEFKGQVLFRYNKYVYISFVASYDAVDGVSRLTRLSASGSDGEIACQAVMKLAAE